MMPPFRLRDADAFGEPAACDLVAALRIITATEAGAPFAPDFSTIA